MAPAAEEGATNCIECGYKRAVKLCEECQDCLCFLCYDNIHSKGNRMNHHWQSLLEGLPLVRVMRSQSMRSVSKSSSLDDAERLRLGVPLSRQPSEDPYRIDSQQYYDASQYWQEYFDEAAQSNYYYNTLTGEATWLSPWEEHEVADNVDGS